MNADIYTGLADEIARLGGIDTIGVVSRMGEVAAAFAGTDIVKKYCDGTKKLSVKFNISGLAAPDEQKELIEKLCCIGEILEKSAPDLDGIQNPKIKVLSPPLPTLRNGEQIIYMMGIGIQFYMKG